MESNKPTNSGSITEFIFLVFYWFLMNSTGKVDVDYKCDLCSVSGNIQECFRCHGVKYQENYAEGEILETFAPALPI